MESIPIGTYSINVTYRAIVPSGTIMLYHRGNTVSGQAFVEIALSSGERWRCDNPLALAPTWVKVKE